MTDKEKLDLWDWSSANNVVFKEGNQMWLLELGYGADREIIAIIDKKVIDKRYIETNGNPYFYMGEGLND